MVTAVLGFGFVYVKYDGVKVWDSKKLIDARCCLVGSLTYY